ncbi:MAG: ParA family protein [Nitrososphaerales archaeon]
MTVAEETKRHRAIRIAFFNHKGGVGKTTLTFNIAATLASLGNTVLLVDSDPQCNLSAYTIEDSVVDDLLDHSDSPKGKTIWSALKPIVEASGDVRTVKPYERRANLFVLPGDVRLSEFEQELAQLWGDCFQRKIRGFKGTTALSVLVNSIAQDIKSDYVFYDSGPNIGPLNRIVLLDCDYFIIPVACDLFSVRALKTLGQTLAKWIKLWETISDLAPDGLYLLPGKPKLLGYIPGRFRIYGGEVTSDYAYYLSLLEKHVHNDVVTVLRNIDPELANSSMIQNKLGRVQDFSSLVSVSQSKGVPIYEVSGGNSSMKAAAQKTFRVLAAKIIERSSK